MRSLITVQELAEQLKVAPQTIYGWTCSRKIPFMKVGGRLRFDPDEMAKWLEKAVVKLD